MKGIFKGEPDFTGCLVVGRIDVLKALNFYSVHASDNDIRDWADAWCKAEGISPNLSKRKPGELSTLAAHWRMKQRGMELTREETEDINQRFLDLHQEHVRESSPKTKEKAPVAFKTHECIADLNGYIDSAARGEVAATRAPSLCKNGKEISLVSEECRKKLLALEAEKEFYSREAFRNIKAAYDRVLKSLETIKNKLKTEKSKKNVASKPPSVIARNVNYMKEYQGIRSLPPERLVGARKAYVYDVVGKRLISYNATSAGFTFSGSTLKNVDTEKCKHKLVKKPEKFFEAKDTSLSYLNKMYSDLPTKELGRNGKFNENMIILSVGGF